MSVLTFKMTDKSGGACDFADLADFSSRLMEALRRVHRAEFPHGVLPRYRIARLETGSAIVGISCDGGSIASFVATVMSIRRRERPHLPTTGDDIRALRALTDTLDSQTKSIFLNESLPIDQDFRTACEFLLDHFPKSYGQAIGRNDGVNIHHRKYLRIYPEGIDRGAQCYFPDEYLERVLASIGKRIRVEGLVHRNPDGTGIDRITDVTALEVLPESHELPSLTSLFGMFADNPIDLCKGWES